ncbi:MAG: hypothetical protein ACFFG0_05630 [Candidatus Thorarchaeota archaeon]
MPDILSAQEGYMYGIRGATFQGGNPLTDQQIPVNPVLSFTGALVEYVQKQLTTCNKLYHNIEFDEKLESGDCTLRTYFRDPFWLLMALGYKGVTTTWTGTGDVITGTFANLNNQDNNIGLVVFEKDQSGNCKHNSILYDGGVCKAYRWIIEQQDGLIEEIDLEFTEVSQHEQPVDIDPNFDDASFNATGAAEVSTVVAVAAASITTGKYFTMEVISTAPYTRTAYYVWFNKDAGGGNPTPSGYTAIEVTVTTGQTAQQVSDAITAAITAKANVTATNGGGTLTTVTITNDNQGDVDDIADVDSGLTVAVSTQGVAPLDGGWSNWDDEYGTDDVVLTKDITITWANVSIAGIEIQSATMEIPTPKEFIFVQSQLKAKDWYHGIRGPFTCEISGILTANTNISEVIAALSSKTTGTLKIQYGTTNVGYAQFTNVYIKGDPIVSLPEAGNPGEITFTFHGGTDSVFTYYWTGNVAQDPSDMINHTNI